MSIALSIPVAAVGAGVGLATTVGSLVSGLFMEESGKPLAATAGVGLAASLAGTTLSGGNPWLIGVTVAAAVPNAALTFLGSMQMYEARKRSS